MAELISRALRDGALEGEHSPALTIKHSITLPLGFHVFSHLLVQLSSNILAGKSQSKGVVVVALKQSPKYYVELLKTRGIDVVSSGNKWILILDCFSDPLGWNHQLFGPGNSKNLPGEISSVCTNVKDLDNLFSSIVKCGKELVREGKGRFSVAIDSVDELLRHTSTSAVAKLISNLRTKVSSSFWLLHKDLHERKTTSVLEYMSSMVANLEAVSQSTKGVRAETENLSLHEQNCRRGKFHVRFKRRNGRVRVMCEECQVDQSRITFVPISSSVEAVNQGLLPKLQFNLQLSEKEQIDRAKVVLPFEHQGTGKPIHIYDGRRLLEETQDDMTLSSVEKLQLEKDSGKGEIIYFRDSDDERPDSDDERPDSDEDPDDDLDI